MRGERWLELLPWQRSAECDARESLLNISVGNRNRLVWQQSVWAFRSLAGSIHQIASCFVIKAIVSVVAFQAAWAACAYGTVHSVPQFGVLVSMASLALGVLLAERRLGRIVLSVLLGLYGLAAETIILRSGVLSYTSPGPYPTVAPVWIIGLWMAFAILIKPAFGWLQGRLLLAALLGAVAGPMSYYAAMRLGALQFAEPEWAGLTAVSVMWAVGMPFALTVSNWFEAPDSEVKQRNRN